MTQSVHSAGSAAAVTQHHRYVHVVLLNKETFVVSVESKNTRVGDIFNKACEHVELRETEFFGLAQLKDNEFQFLQPELKISKLASKIWKSKEFSGDEPLQTFYLRVQYYVDNICLLKEKTTRLQCYLQLRDNLLHYNQAVPEEKCFLLASYALQADFGNYSSSCHGNNYFDPREYFPASVVMRRGQDYITTHLPEMHKSMAGMLSPEARVNYMSELSAPPIAHNFHFYKMRKRKYDTSALVWIAICPKGLEIYEDSNDFRCLLSVFLWPDIKELHCGKKKFEIVTEGVASRKYTFYADCKEWADYILDLCRQTHSFHLTLQSRLAELSHLEAYDQRYREMYVYSENAEFTLDRGRSQASVTTDGHSLPAVQEQQAVPSANSLATNNYASNTQEKESEQHEIFITAPPRPTSRSTRSCELPHFLPSSGSNQGKQQSNQYLIQEAIQQLKRRQAGENYCNGTGRDDNEISASSSESLVVFAAVDGISGDCPCRLPSSSESSSARSLVASTLATPQFSASPNSSAGSSQLPLSLPASQVYDAAFIRESLPDGMPFNQYLQNVWSGQGTASNSVFAPRKSSLDYHQLHSNVVVEPVQRSTSLRQPLVDRGEDGKTRKLSPYALCLKVQSGLSIARSNSDKAQKSSGLTIHSDFVSQPAVKRSDSNKSQKSMFALPSNQTAVVRDDSNKSQKSAFALPSTQDAVSWNQKSTFALPSGQATVTRSESNKSQKSTFMLPSGQVTVTRSESNKSQKSAFALPSNQVTVTRSESNKSQKSAFALPSNPKAVTRSESNKSQKSTFTFPSEVTLNQTVMKQSSVLRDGSSVATGKEDIPPVSSLPYAAMAPVEAQIQKVIFVPIMTAVSTPVRPTPERPAGNLSTVTYHPPSTYIPENFPPTVIRPAMQQVNYNAVFPAGIKPRPLFQPPQSSSYASVQSSVIQPVEDDNSCHEKGSPPPYGAFHSTIMSASAVAVNPATTQIVHSTQGALNDRDPTAWLPTNGNGASRQPLQFSVQTASSVNTQQGVRSENSDQGSGYKSNRPFAHLPDATTASNQQSNKSKRGEVTRHVSDRYPASHDPQCPRHGSGSDIREKLRSLGSSVPPMLNALLTDKTLHDTRCTCGDENRSKHPSFSHPAADSASRHDTKTQPQTWTADPALHQFLNSSVDNDATMIINGTMTLNGTLHWDDMDEDNQRELNDAGGLKGDSTYRNRQMHHSSDLAEQPSLEGQRPLNHNQSNSDSAAQTFVSSER